LHASLIFDFCKFVSIRTPKKLIAKRQSRYKLSGNFLIENLSLPQTSPSARLNSLSLWDAQCHKYLRND